MRIRDVKLATEICKGLSIHNGVTRSPESILRSPHYVIYEGKNVLGWVGVTRRRRGDYEVRHLTVLPEARRRGVGSAALKHIFRLLRSKGAKQCHAFIRRSNHASIRLFEKHGFLQVRDGWVKKFHKTLSEEP